MVSRLTSEETSEEDRNLPLPVTVILKDEWLHFQISSFIAAWDGLRALALFGPMFSHIRPLYLAPMGDAFAETGVTIFLLMSGVLATSSLRTALVS
jgi:peptidoglycan/LPS O-acetylase OafA/YrhL